MTQNVRKRTFWAKFSLCEWEERRALAEALILLVLAAPAIQILPLRWVGRIAALGPARAGNLSASRQEELTWMVRWAVDRAAKRSPLRAKCFEQGLAAQIMLRRRGIDSTLFYGMTRRQDHACTGQLYAHVWIETEHLPVVGDPDPDCFALMATWPQGRQPSWALCRNTV